MDKYIGTVLRNGFQPIRHAEIPLRSAGHYLSYFRKMIALYDLFAAVSFFSLFGHQYDFINKAVFKGFQGIINNRLFPEHHILLRDITVHTFSFSGSQNYRRCFFPRVFHSVILP